MKFVLAPDSFKGSMSASVAAGAMAAGVQRALPGALCELVPMSDGGEGLVDALTAAIGGQVVGVAAHDALGRPIQARIGVAPGGLAVIETASAAGLDRIAPAERDVRRASTFGAGELVRAALDRGTRRLIVGLGGSATNDAGSGWLSALGARFLDGAGAELPPGGASLAGLARVDVAGLDARLAACRIDVACDVDNPLLGRDGASAVFGPQKGASASDVVDLDAALTRWADVVEACVGRSVRDAPGAGAAGGLGAALLAFTPARLRTGIDIVMDAVDFDAALAGADCVFTGEGCVDAQTRHGKVPWGVLRRAQRFGVPTVIFGGQVTPEAEELLDAGAAALVPIGRTDQTLDAALAAGPANLAAAAETATRRMLGAGPECLRPHHPGQHPRRPGT